MRRERGRGWGYYVAVPRDGQYIIDLCDRVLGRTIIGDIKDPGNDKKLLIKDRTMLDEKLTALLEEKNIDQILPTIKQTVFANELP